QDLQPARASSLDMADHCLAAVLIALVHPQQIFLTSERFHGGYVFGRNKSDLSRSRDDFGFTLAIDARSFQLYAPRLGFNRNEIAGPHSSEIGRASCRERE